MVRRTKENVARRLPVRRGLDENEAGVYLSLSPSFFRRLVLQKLMPRPRVVGGRPEQERSGQVNVRLPMASMGVVERSGFKNSSSSAGRRIKPRIRMTLGRSGLCSGSLMGGCGRRRTRELAIYCGTDLE